MRDNLKMANFQAKVITNGPHNPDLIIKVNSKMGNFMALASCKT
jgi:hypothetical protein